MPALDVSALRTQLKTGALAGIYLFVGEDLKLIDRMVDAVETTIDPADRPFAVERLYAGDSGASPLEIAAAARAYPMLGDRRIVIVRRAERLLKPKRASKAVEIDEGDDGREADEAGVDSGPLEDYFGSPVPSTTLVFVASEIDKTRRLTKRLLEKAQVVVFGGLGEAGPGGRRDTKPDATALIKDELVKAGRTIDPAALARLADSGADITRLRSDIERLLLYTEGRPRISLEDVTEVVTAETTVADDWALVNALAEGDPARALADAAARLDRGDSPHALIGQLRWWVSTRLAEGAPARVPAALEALLRTDLALKSSGGDERVPLERLVVELTGKPLPRRGWR